MLVQTSFTFDFVSFFYKFTQVLKFISRLFFFIFIYYCHFRILVLNYVNIRIISEIVCFFNLTFELIQFGSSFAHDVACNRCMCGSTDIWSTTSRETSFRCVILSVRQMLLAIHLVQLVIVAFSTYIKSLSNQRIAKKCSHIDWRGSGYKTEQLCQ